ncbi:MAG: hypothetical protein L6R41_008359, partial [Letrouitia leprolyta]
MLLKMRPNLQVVQLVGMSWDNKPLKEMIWAIAAANQDLASLLQGKALAHLTAIDIIANDIEGDEDIHLYTPFAALPALRSIHGRQINGIVSDLYGDRSESESREEYNDNFRGQFVGDLKAFKKVEILRLDDTTFQKKYAGNIVRLVDILPASLRKLTPVPRISRGDRTDVFI